jgi:hypothetical protein
MSRVRRTGSWLWDVQDVVALLEAGERKLERAA